MRGDECPTRSHRRLRRRPAPRRGGPRRGVQHRRAHPAARLPRRGGGAERRADPSSSVRLAPDKAIASCRGPIDTLICAGGTGVREAARDDQLVRWVKGAAKRSRRTASVCTGAFLLAEAGLLDGKRATTHWSGCAALATRYPGVTVEPDPIFVQDGNVYTSAGVTAGMDLALALVDEDLGRDVALETARWLVLFLRRPGGQSQFSAQLAAQAAEREPLQELQAWIPDNLKADLGARARAARGDERAQPRPRLQAGGGPDPRGVRRELAGRARESRWRPAASRWS